MIRKLFDDFWKIFIIPATADSDAIKTSLDRADSTVLMKVYKNFPEVVEELANHEMIDEAVLVSRCGLDDERIIRDVSAHKNEALNYLSTILTRKRQWKSHEILLELVW